MFVCNICTRLSNIIYCQELMFFIDIFPESFVSKVDHALNAVVRNPTQ